MNELYTLLIPYFVALSGVTCIQPMQNVKIPALPYVTLDIQSTQQTGGFVEGRDDSASTETTQRNFTFTLDVNVYGRNNRKGEAMDIAQRILDGMEDHNRRLLAMGDVLAYQDMLSAPNDITGLIADQYQPRVNMAMRWHTARRATYSLNMIDHVEVTPQAPFNPVSV
jgi:hypothetical protein